MYNCYLVNKEYKALNPELEPIPYPTEEQAVQGAGKLLQQFDCNIIWMKNVDSKKTRHLNYSENVVAVYSGDKDICVLISDLTFTGDDGNPTPQEEEVGPFYLRR